MSCGTFQGSLSNPDPNATPTEIICRGSDPNFKASNWFQYWSQENGKICLNEFLNILYSGSATGLRSYDPTKLERVRADMNNAFATYIQLHPITSLNDPKFNPFQEVLLQTCTDAPGLCTDFQTSYCSGCTRDQISTNTQFIRLCGCEAPLPPPEYNITQACDPLCNRVNAIHNINETTGQTKICESDTCVIDNNSINATKTTIGGGIIFSQMCSNCKSNCKCIIASTDINGVLTETGLTNVAQFNSACAAGSSCFVNDANGNLSSVVCPKTANFEYISKPVAINDLTIWLILVVGLILVLAILAIYLYK